jgi:uncharacterized protein involved in exopolysaccharide biosynthesis
VSIGDIALSLRRQWLSVLLGLVLTAVACSLIATVAVPPTYRATASVVLLPSPQTLPDERDNPFLYLGGTNPMRDLVARSATANIVSARLLDGTVETTYEVYPDATAAPILVAVVAGPTPEQTLRTLSAVLEQIDRSLVEVQDGHGVAEAVRVVSQQLSVDSEAQQVRSTTLRAVVGFAGLGVCITLLYAIWVDTLRQGRRRSSNPDDELPGQEVPINEPAVQRHAGPSSRNTSAHGE